MKKTLLILRHAMPEDYSSQTQDDLRKLTELGVAQANEVSKALLSEGITPNRVISSDAVRARHTAEIVCGNLGVNFTVNGDLYSSSINRVMSTISKVSSDVDTLMIVGHNPTFTEITMKISESPVALRQADCVVLTADIEDWGLVDAVVWDLIKVVQPLSR